MALFEWQSDYSVKVPSIDAQHRKLVDMLNSLHDGMVSGNATDRLAPLLEGLIDYAAKHFAYEEQLFARHDYPGAKVHIEEHQRLASEVVAFQKKVLANQASVKVELMKFLKDWLIEHIRGSDKAYSAHLVDRGVK